MNTNDDNDSRERVNKKSSSLNDIGKYRLELFQHSADDMTLIIDHIRNYREIPKDMIQKITFMTDDAKMSIIREFNRVIGALHDLL